MKHPYSTYVKVEVITIVLAILFGITAMLRNSSLLLLVSLLWIAISLICSALVEQVTFQQTKAIKIIVRAILLFIVTFFLIIQLLVKTF